MPSRVIRSRRDPPDLVDLGDRHGGSGAKLHGPELEDLRRAIARSLDMVERDVDHQGLLFVRLGPDVERETEVLANSKARRHERKRVDYDFRPGIEAEELQDLRVALFDEGPGSLSDDPLPFRRSICCPPTAHVDDKVRIVFRDVVEVVRYGAAYVLSLVVLEILDQLKDGARVVLESLESPRPRKTLPRSLRDKSPATSSTAVRVGR